ncbi:fimbrial chaperone protein, partial [Escherichia coli]|nr:fimbrial chaperone protein [Escherichia coli]
TWLKNPTPYYMAIVDMKISGKSVSLDKSTLAELSQLKPFSEISLKKKIGGTVSIDAINDWGGIQNYEVK